MSKVQEPPDRSHEVVLLDGHNLTLEQVESVSRHGVQVELSSTARSKVQESAETLQHLVASDTPVYGVNTGFGIFADRKIDHEQSLELSRNLILSHAVGTGPHFSEDIVRAAMLIRANTLARGHSGVRPLIIDTLLSLLNQRLIPIIPSQGSLGSSGDLAPLAHLALAISASPGDQDAFDGEIWFQGERMSGSDAMSKARIKRPILGPKEGLALTNGATFSAALLSLACRDVRRLLLNAEIAAALSFEALLGVSGALDPRLHDVRPHPGQIAVAQRLRQLTNGSTLIDEEGRVQDAYSLRCTPQVIGPAWDTLRFVQETVSRELNAVTDNPLLFDDVALSGGNFHGEPIGLGADYLKIALHVVGALSERRVFRLISSDTNAGLPPMLVSKPEFAGLYSGMMMLQYTAASLTLENQALSFPDSIHSLPTSAGQEDFNSNSTTAGRHLLQIVSNLSRILAVELIAAAQALDLRLEQRPHAKPGTATAAVHERIRQTVPFSAKDSPMAEEIVTVARLILEGEFIRSAEEASAVGA